jgi:hypothetical protein
MAMEPLYEPGVLGIIRGGLLSGDSRHIANACEVLGNLDGKQVIKTLSKILENAAGHDACRDGATFRNLDDALHWCSSHGNDWLKTCGMQALDVKDARPV